MEGSNVHPNNKTKKKGVGAEHKSMIYCVYCVCVYCVYCVLCVCVVCMYCVYRARVCNIHMAATVPRLRTALSRSRRPPGVARIPAAGTGSQYRAVCLRGFIMQIIQYYILLISLSLSLSLSSFFE